jgi:hypothetical protein
MKHTKHGDSQRELDGSHIGNPDVAHEESDVRIKPIAIFCVGLTVAAIVIHLLIAGLFKYFEDRERKSEGPPGPLAAERQVIPPEPRLQLAPREENQRNPLSNEHPIEEMKRVLAEENGKLDSYGWVDQQAGKVRIPIEEAKRLLVERGLPSRAQAQGNRAPAAASGASLPLESGSGRVPERRQP